MLAYDLDFIGYLKSIRWVTRLENTELNGEEVQYLGKLMLRIIAGAIDTSVVFKMLGYLLSYSKT